MSKEKFAEVLKNEPSIGAVEAVREGIQAIAPGLSLGKILGDIGEELKYQVKAGSHELAAVLFRGDGFVMYPKEGKEDEGHGLPEAAKEHERGGRE